MVAPLPPPSAGHATSNPFNSGPATVSGSISPQRTLVDQLATAPATQALTALVLIVVSFIFGGLCLAIPGMILAYRAKAITDAHIAHPDSGMAKAAIIAGWVQVVLTILGLILVALIIGFSMMSGQV